jgi:hypothetical protein
VITYNLSCARGHEFEGWFKDSAAYEVQEAQGVLTCPICGDAEIKKAIMAPAVISSPVRAMRPVPAGAPPVAPEQQRTHQFVTGFRKFVEENAEYVGRRFPDEARKIHYGESDDRHIYGESTIGEARELIEEGIDVAPMPPDPEDLN